MGKLNHVAIACPDLDKATSLYKDILGAKVSEKQVSLATLSMYSVVKCLYLVFFVRARCRSVVEHLLMVRWVIGLIPHGGPTELFLFPADVTKTVVCVLLSVGWSILKVILYYISDSI